ncbi:MAG: GntR family transcriptional regulator [Chitinivibrionales bacterium]|nr:GntR family transcriptional regulator [Chitinivibrionales bacterium]
MAKKGQGFNLACAAIEKAIKAAQDHGSKRLPTIVRIAASAGLSPETIRKALAYYREKGILRSAPGRGIILGDTIEAVPAFPVSHKQPPPKQLTWQKALTLLKSDIMAGAFGWDMALPSLKELQRRYGISYRTLKKVLDSCTDERLLVAYGRQYKTFSPGVETSGLRIIVIGQGQKDRSIARGIDGNQFIQTLEHICTKSRIKLEVYASYINDGSVNLIDTATGKQRSIDASDDIIGFIFIAIGPQIKADIRKSLPSRQELDAQLFNPVLRLLWHCKKNVAIYTHDQRFVVPGIISKSPLFQIFCISATGKSAYHVARFLISKGHKRVAYICPFHKAGWSVNRLALLRKVFAETEMAGALSEAVLPEYEELMAVYQEAQQFYDIKPLIHAFAAWKESNKALAIPHMEHAVNTLFERQRLLDTLYNRLVPKLQLIAQDKSITAWICANDGIAEMVLKFLHQQRINLPNDLSLISFDDSPIALDKRLASYNFNVPSVAQLIFQYLLNPGLVRGGRRRKVIEIDGMIVERESVRTI